MKKYAIGNNAMKLGVVKDYTLSPILFDNKKEAERYILGGGNNYTVREYGM